MDSRKAAKQILIVEDERIVAEEIKANLEDFGYPATHILSEAEEAIRFCRSHKPDLVIMDIILEGEMEGLEAAEVIFKELDVPIVFLTAHADLKTIERALKSQPFGYIMKPYEATELKATVEVALYKHSQERKLKASEERFRKLAENSRDMIFRMIIPQGKYEYVNPACSHITGYEEKDFYANDLFIRDLVHPEWRIYFEQEWQKIISSEPVSVLEYQIVDNSGIPRWLHQTNVFISDDNGKLTHLEGIITDITNIRDYLQTIRKKEKDLRNIIESIREGIIIMDRENTVTYANQAIEDMCGMEKSELVGQKLTDLHPFIKLNFLQPGTTEQVTVSMTCEIENEKKPGEKTYTEITHIPMFLENRYNGCINIFRDTSEKRADEIKLQKSYQKSRKLLQDTVNGLLATVEIRDPYTAQHQRRVAKLARAIAGEMNLEPNQVERVYTASMLHDIGKMNIPSDILGKGGKLIDAELDLIKLHPQSGYEILKSIEFPWPIARIVLQHHELIDGSGYPRGLKGDEILKEARIICVADVTEAMSNHRPYRPQMEIDSALEELIQNRGVLYDEEAVDACVNLFHNQGFTFQD